VAQGHPTGLERHGSARGRAARRKPGGGVVARVGVALVLREQRVHLGCLVGTQLEPLRLPGCVQLRQGVADVGAAVGQIGLGLGARLGARLRVVCVRAVLGAASFSYSMAEISRWSRRQLTGARAISRRLFSI
jgi:hypothetical protein